MFGLIALAVTHPALIGQVQQQETMYRNAVQVPTGKNGYEEYLQAADLIANSKERSLIITAGSNPVTKPVLAARREVLSKFVKVIDLVRKGNAKEVYDPRTTVGAATLYPEFAEFKSIARIFVCESYIRFADGNPRAGTQAIMDGLTFARKASQTTLISYLVSVAITAIMLAEAENHLYHFSEPDAIRLIDYCTKAVADTQALVKAMEGERTFMQAEVKSLLSDPKKYLGVGDTYDTEQTAALLKTFGSMDPATRGKVGARVMARIDDQFNRISNLMSQPVKNWDSPPELPAMDDSAEGLLLEMVMPIHSQVLLAAGKSQAQLALLRVHAYIIKYRWQHNTLPASLKVLENDEHIIDPISGEPFEYKILGPNSYELFSKGFKSTGPIHLKYKREPKEDGGGPPPPSQ
jgi:hypothetical protein